MGRSSCSTAQRRANGMSRPEPTMVASGPVGRAAPWKPWSKNISLGARRSASSTGIPGSGATRTSSTSAPTRQGRRPWSRRLCGGAARPLHATPLPFRAPAAGPQWQGMFSMALPSLIPNAAVAGSVIEFGTFPNAQVRASIMIDRFLRFGRSNRSSVSTETLREQMLGAFAPRDPAWRTAILERSLDVHRKALDGLAAW